MFYLYGIKGKYFTHFLSLFSLASRTPQLSPCFTTDGLHSQIVLHFAHIYHYLSFYFWFKKKEKEKKLHAGLPKNKKIVKFSKRREDYHIDKNISTNKPFVTAKKFIFWKKEKKKRKRFWGKCDHYGK